MYEQVYTPEINTPAQPGWCQKYIDDAGSVPNTNPPRTGTAKASYMQEHAAGRISTADFPENVWVVAWFSFDRGSYTYPNGETVYYVNAWHVAFVKRTGNKLEIHDSEVHSGSRQPYTSITVVEMWFANYGAKYVGWSTHSDGRQYAKKKEEKEVVTKSVADALYLFYLGTSTSQWGLNNAVGKMTAAELQNHLLNSDALKLAVKRSASGELSAEKHLPYVLRSVYKNPAKVEYVEVTEKLYKKKG